MMDSGSIPDLAQRGLPRLPIATSISQPRETTITPIGSSRERDPQTLLVAEDTVGNDELPIFPPQLNRGPTRNLRTPSRTPPSTIGFPEASLIWNKPSSTAPWVMVKTLMWALFMSTRLGFPSGVTASVARGVLRPSRSEINAFLPSIPSNATREPSLLSVLTKPPPGRTDAVTSVFELSSMRFTIPPPPG